jgi:L-alanine-DL-glutamate epimerase-like enolase superfamily enzyme
MKITEVKVWLVEGVKYNWTLLKIYTDTGHTGVGEATNWPGSPIVYNAAKHVVSASSALTQCGRTLSGQNFIVILTG